MKTIIAAFRDQATADEAIAFLNDNGVTDIEVLNRDESGPRARQHLRELNVPDDRAELYAVCVDRGAPVIAAHTDHNAEQLAHELDRLGSLDLERAGRRESQTAAAEREPYAGSEREAEADAQREREAGAESRRQAVAERQRETETAGGEREGIGERMRDAAERARAAVTGHRTDTEREGEAGTAPKREMAPPSAQGAATSESVSGEIDVIEESVRVGKREVPLGAVRVHAFVLEHPVREQIELTEERIDVSREAANEPLSAAAAEKVLTEDEFVVTARGEEAVVSKEARVVERVHVGKTAETHTETIEETERRRDVEVEVEPVREEEPGTDRGPRR